MKNIKAFLSSLRISRHIYYTAVFCAGYDMAIKMCSSTLHALLLIEGFFLINILFAASLILNNIYDAPIDAVNNKGNTLNITGVTQRGYLYAFFFLLATSVSLSLAVSIPVLIAVIAIHVAAWIYSCPPFRLKKYFPVNTLLIAFSTSLALVLGYLLAGGIFSKLPFAAIAVFTALLFMAFNTKDVNDYEGDKKYSVMTLMTIFGPEKGRFVTASLAYAAYLLVPLLLHSALMLAPSIILGGATFYIIMRKGKVNEAIVFALMFIYAALFFKLA